MWKLFPKTLAVQFFLGGAVIILERKEEFYKESLKCQYLFYVLESLIYNTVFRPLGGIIEDANSKYVEYEELTN